MKPLIAQAIVSFNRLQSSGEVAPINAVLMLQDVQSILRGLGESVGRVGRERPSLGNIASAMGQRRTLMQMSTKIPGRLATVQSEDDRRGHAAGPKRFDFPVPGLRALIESDGFIEAEQIDIPKLRRSPARRLVDLRGTGKRQREEDKKTSHLMSAAAIQQAPTKYAMNCSTVSFTRVSAGRALHSSAKRPLSASASEVS